jgi:uncharacterized protein YjlB
MTLFTVDDPDDLNNRDLSLEALGAYRVADDAFRAARTVRDQYWSEHYGQPGFDRHHYHRLHAHCIAAHADRDQAAFKAGMDPYDPDRPCY